MNNFKGIIDEYRFIAVDYFDGRSLDCSAFFLSHCHTDHMIGLKGTAFLSRLKSSSDSKLYCSTLTRELVLGHRKFQHLEPYMVALEVSAPVSLSGPNADSFQYITVTLLPAGHCPGSVMFLFEGENGNVLYTGDFRLTGADLHNMKPLFLSENDFKPIRKLYIDTTFCVLDALEFPSRTESRNALISVIETWLREDPQNVVCVRGSAQFGTEYIYVQIKEKFNMKVHVANHMLRKYSAVQDIFDAVTVDGRATRIHACRAEVLDGDEDVRSNYCGECSKRWDKSLHVKLSTQWFVYNEKRKCGDDRGKRPEVLIRKSTRSCRVWFSMHSSLSEILDVVKLLQPSEIVPLVVPQEQMLSDVLRLLYSQVKRNGADAVLSAEKPPTTVFGTLNNHVLKPLDGVEMSLDFVSTLESPLLTPPKWKRSRHNSAGAMDGLGSPKRSYDVPRANGSEDGQADSPKWTFEPSPVNGVSQNFTSVQVRNSVDLQDLVSNPESPMPTPERKCSRINSAGDNDGSGSPKCSYDVPRTNGSEEGQFDSPKWTFEPSPVKRLSQNSLTSSQTSQNALNALDSPQWTYEPSPVKSSSQNSLTESQTLPNDSMGPEESTESPKWTYEPSSAKSSQSSFNGESSPVKSDNDVKVRPNRSSIRKQLSFSRYPEKPGCSIRKSSPEVIDITSDSADTIVLIDSDSMTPEMF